MKYLISAFYLFSILSIEINAQLELSIDHKIKINAEYNISDTSVINEISKKINEKFYEQKGFYLMGMFDGRKFNLEMKFKFNSYKEKFDWYFKNNVYGFFDKLKADYKITIDPEDNRAYQEITPYSSLAKRKLIKPGKENSGCIKGQIIDYDTKEPLIGSNIIFLETPYGAATDVNGNFQIEEIPGGIYKIKVSYIGYKEETIDSVIISANSELKLNIELKDFSYEWEEQADIDIRNGDIFILVGGLAVFPIDFEKLNEIADDYGFQYEVMGCEFLWGDKYNKKMYAYLDKINEEGWREKMQKDIEEVSKEEMEELKNNN